MSGFSARSSEEERGGSGTHEGAGDAEEARFLACHLGDTLLELARILVLLRAAYEEVSGGPRRSIRCSTGPARTKRETHLVHTVAERSLLHDLEHLMARDRDRVAAGGKHGVSLTSERIWLRQPGGGAGELDARPEVPRDCPAPCLDPLCPCCALFRGGRSCERVWGRRARGGGGRRGELGEAVGHDGDAVVWMSRAQRQQRAAARAQHERAWVDKGEEPHGSAAAACRGKTLRPPLVARCSPD